MKTGVSLSVFPAKTGMPALYSGAGREQIAQIRSLGYDGVDLFVDDPLGKDTGQAVRLLRKAGMGIGVMMPASLAGRGLYLGDRKVEVRRETVRRLRELIVLAAENGAMVSLGLVRGNRHQEESIAEFEDRFTESCLELLAFSEPRKVPLVIEPINRYETNTMNTVASCVDFIQRQKLPLYIMADTFHMNIEDGEIGDTLVGALPYIKHIHFLDSNRLAPSMGHLDMEGYYRRLETAGYEGYLCLEALPQPSTEVCAGTGAEFFRRMKSR